MRTIVLLLTIAIATSALGAEKAYKDLDSNANGSFHIDSKGFNKKQTENIDPLFNRAHELLDSHNFNKERCPELKEISLKLQTFWINADYDNRKRINDIRIATENSCGKL